MELAAKDGFWLVEVKLLGPVQLYVVPVEEAESVKVDPIQTGFGLALAVGATGVEFTVTETVPAELVHPLVVAVTEYVPPFALEAIAKDGFWLVDVKLFGPVQLYVVPVAVAVKFKVAPTQSGLGLAPAVGAVGIAFTVTETVPAVPVQPPAVATTEYVPLCPTELVANEGF